MDARLSLPSWLGYIPRLYTRPKTVTHPSTHPSTNRAQRWATSCDERRYHSAKPPVALVCVWLQCFLRARRWLVRIGTWRGTADTFGLRHRQAWLQSRHLKSHRSLCASTTRSGQPVSCFDIFVSCPQQIFPWRCSRSLTAFSAVFCWLGGRKDIRCCVVTFFPLIRRHSHTNQILLWCCLLGCTVWRTIRQKVFSQIILTSSRNRITLLAHTGGKVCRPNSCLRLLTAVILVILFVIRTWHVDCFVEKKLGCYEY